MNRRPILFAAGIATSVIAIVAVAMWLAVVAPTRDTLLPVDRINRLVRAREVMTPFLFALPPCGTWLVYRARRGSRVVIAVLIAVASIPVAWLPGFILFAAGERIWIDLALSLTR